LVHTLNHIEADTFHLSAQDDKQATHAPKLSKDMGRIDWQKPAFEIHNQIRGLQPWPGAYTTFEGKILKIIQAEISEKNRGTSVPGQILSVDKHGFVVAASDQSLLIKEVQPEAGKAMPAQSFVAGHKITVGSFFKNP
jgi:methionyl-tRNA formyltransferase